MSSYGFVYVLENHAMPGLLKIGHTMRSPRQRAVELSASSGVPMEFDVAYYAEVESPQQVEMEVHARLGGKRVNQSREFFAAELEEAIHAVRCCADVWSEAFCTNRACAYARGSDQSEVSIGGVH